MKGGQIPLSITDYQSTISENLGSGGGESNMAPNVCFCTFHVVQPLSKLIIRTGCHLTHFMFQTNYFNLKRGEKKCSLV